MSHSPDSTPSSILEPPGPAATGRRAVLCYVLALIVTIGVSSAMMYQQYRQEISTAELRMEARASVVAQWTSGIMGQSEQALFSLSELMSFFENEGGRNPEALEQALDHLTRYVTSVDEMGVLDASGRVILASDERYEGVSYRDAGFFEAFKSSDLVHDATTLQRSPESGEVYLYSARRRDDAQGEFAGIVVSRIRPQIFADALSRVGISDGESIALIDTDYQLIARHAQPPLRVSIGQRLELPATWTPLASNEYSRTFVMRSPIDHRERLLHMERVGDYPIYAVVGVDRQHLLSEWRDRVALLCFVMILIALLGAWGLRHYLNRLALARLLQTRIEERELARAQARERDVRLDALVNSLQDLIFVFDEQGRFSYVHAIDRTRLLLEPELIIGRHFTELLPKDLAEAFQNVFERVKRLRQVENYEYPLTLDGKLNHFNATVSPLTDVSGQFSGVLSVVRDITEDKKLQAELRIAAAAFQTHLGILITDCKGYILKTNDTFRRITGYSEEEMVGKTPRMFSSGQHGAAFYRELWQRVHQSGNWEGEIWNKRKNGELFPQWITISATYDDSDTLSHYVATISDISERKAAEQEIHQLAFYDPLTGLSNRRLFMDRLETALKEINRHQRFGAVMLFDIDSFKEINDTLGYHAGDQLLRGVSRRLSRMLRDTDTLARLGGDEFAVLVEGVDSSLAQTHQLARGIANKLMATLSEPIRINDSLITVTASVGATMMSNDQQNMDDYLQQADMALSQAKASGRQALRFFTPDMQAELLTRVRLEADLRQAVIFKQWHLFYQPQVDADGTLTGVEALLRWDHAERGIISPGAFMPLLESTGLINEVGEWILEQACWQLIEWARDPILATLTLSINLSPLQFREPGFVRRTESVFQRTQAPLSRLKLEVTESLFVEAPEEVRDTMLRLKAHGVRFSLDDFGTGYSSLSYLAQLPLDQLKIDQSFVQQVPESSANAAIVSTTIALASSLSLDVIAEGVETQEQYQWLLANGCYAFQGYLFGRPMPVAALEAIALSAKERPDDREGSGDPGPGRREE
ncbi:EAL domain-containing protein [Halomonas sp. PAMB 3232]|uniref:bifunctional diguanylate cyclase/phosphodiesterase n=1 Tax=Halomonas sp. PAMB 3232 TaxID=3075221 RepID=UPI00289E69D2|nr:EAL domain-containing protein [Halomonas sp. PAMB 3232]WNL38576.1 EAL domain-containing protein [Halomonas sp. PAMB 3232]